MTVDIHYTVGAHFIHSLKLFSSIIHSYSKALVWIRVLLYARGLSTLNVSDINRLLFRHLGSWSCHLCLDLLKDKASIYQNQNAPPSWWKPSPPAHSHHSTVQQQYEFPFKIEDKQLQWPPQACVLNRQSIEEREFKPLTKLATSHRFDFYSFWAHIWTPSIFSFHLFSHTAVIKCQDTAALAADFLFSFFSSSL